MNCRDLFGYRKLKCPKCDHTQMFYVGTRADNFDKEFSIEERTCENCKQHVWRSGMYTVLTGGWTTSEIIEAIKSELEVRIKHSQTNYPLTLCKVLESKGVPEHIIQDILIDFFKQVIYNGKENSA